MLTVGSANIYSFLHEESFVPPWRKFLSTMVERKIPHIGKNKVCSLTLLVDYFQS